MAEVAWDAQGNYCGDEDAQHAGYPWVLDVEHGRACPDDGCGADDVKRCGVFVCERCNRAVGWCFGGCDDSMCDDCWSELWWRDREAVERIAMSPTGETKAPKYGEYIHV